MHYSLNLFEKAFVDGPSTVTGVVRQAIPFKRLSLTDIVIPIQRNPRLKTLTKAFEEAKVLEKWEKTAWSKKQAIKTKRASLNDFDRFKVMLGRKEVRVFFTMTSKIVCNRFQHNTDIFQNFEYSALVLCGGSLRSL